MFGLFSRKAAAAALPARVEPTFQNSSPENPSTSLANPADWLVSVMGGGPTLAGPVVSEQSAMRASVVLACVSLISGLVASLPLHVYKRAPKGRELADTNRLYPLLHDNPNEIMSGFTWRELIAVDLLLGGNHFSAKEYDGAGRVVGFFPIPRNAVIIDRARDGRLKYHVTLVEGGVEIIDQDDILHIPGLGFDGVRGLSVISNMRQAIGLSLAMEEGMSRMHSNGARPSGVVKAEQGYGDDPVAALRRIRAQFEQAYAGLANTGKTVFLDKGMSWTPMQINPVDAETLDHRRFQVADICRGFLVPPFMIGETEKSTAWGTGLEQQTLGFLTFGMQRWLTRIEAEVNRKLFSGSQFYAEFDRDALLAMDSKARGEYFGSLIQNGVITPAHAAKVMNFPHRPEADKLFINSACVPLESAGAQPKPQGANDAQQA
ncbi:MAG: phage portal protein [Rhodoblastus sp.]